MTPVVTPDRTVEQRLDALEEANRVRVYRADVKYRIRAGKLDWRNLLDDVDLQTMKVAELLLQVPKVGPVKVKKILDLARVSPSKTLGGMTDRQVDALELAADLVLIQGRIRQTYQPRAAR
jgi:hypothetical protein